MIIQYVFLRTDIKNIKKGSLIAQGIHASLKAIHEYYTCPDTIKYLKEINTMTTAVLKINENDINVLEGLLKDKDYIKWIEQPENVITGIALRPYNKEDLADISEDIKKYKLF